MTRIITVASQKGGVGKTTTIVNLASWLALYPVRKQETPKVLVIDIDPQGSTSQSLGMLPEKVTHGGMKEVLEKDALQLLAHNYLEEVIYKTPIKNLFVAPSNMAEPEQETALVKAAIESPNLLRDAIDQISEHYDYILIDAPPTLTGLTKMAIAGADSVIIPLQCEYMSLKYHSPLLDLIVDVRKHLNPWLQLEGILLTMYDDKTSYSSRIVREAKKQFGSLMFESIIPRHARLSEASALHRPVVLYDIRSPGSVAYFKLAKEITQRHPKVS